MNLLTGEVYGHVVSADAFGEASVIPIQTSFKVVKEQLHARDVELPTSAQISQHQRTQRTVASASTKIPVEDETTSEICAPEEERAGMEGSRSKDSEVKGPSKLAKCAPSALDSDLHSEDSGAADRERHTSTLSRDILDRNLGYHDHGYSTIYRDLEIARKETERWRARVGENEKQLRETRNEFERTKTLMIAFESKARALSREINRLTEINQDLTKTNQDLTNANRGLSKTNRDLTRANQDLIRTNQDITRTNQDIIRANRELTKTRQDLTKANQDLTKTNQTLTKTNQGLTETDQVLTEINQDLSRTGQGFIDTTRGLSDRIVQLEEDLLMKERSKANYKSSDTTSRLQDEKKLPQSSSKWPLNERVDKKKERGAYDDATSTKAQLNTDRFGATPLKEEWAGGVHAAKGLTDPDVGPRTSRSSVSPDSLPILRRLPSHDQQKPPNDASRKSAYDYPSPYGAPQDRNISSPNPTSPTRTEAVLQGARQGLLAAIKNPLLPWSALLGEQETGTESANPPRHASMSASPPVKDRQYRPYPNRGPNDMNTSTPVAVHDRAPSPSRAGASTGNTVLPGEDVLFDG